MRSSSHRRIGAVAWPIALGAFVLASCGTDSAAEPTRTTLSLSAASTAFVVKPPVTTLPPGTDPAADGTAGAQEYTVQAGDYPLKVAEQFGVTLDDLVRFNGWASFNEFPFPGTVIKIPPGGTATAAPADPAVDAAPLPTTAPPAGAIPDAGDNCAAGQHTVVSGDYPLALARKYDVTLEALDAANAGNPAYEQFVPGQTIIIPPKSNC